ncbi:MAG: MerR family transcriptional regulator [Chitinophagaceae bacterium]|nr:MAG: MerR family transcriptional regulator [Chitinophagaceae bacterium]
MNTENLVTAIDFCSCHQIEVSFIRTLSESGLIETTEIQQQVYLSRDELEKLERIVQLHYNMDINLEGVEAIDHLLGQIRRLQDEVTALKNKLRFYE